MLKVNIKSEPMPMSRSTFTPCRLSALILSCGLLFLSEGHCLAADGPPSDADIHPPRTWDEFKPLTGLDNTPRGGTLPGGTLPGGTVPGGTLPGGTVPGGTPRGGTLPGGTLPGGTVPGGTLPGGTVPGGTLPGGTPPGGPL
jgi:hypothetical protein